MKEALAGLLGSKKVVLALITVIVATGAKLGYDVDKEYVAMILGFGGLVITTIGLADFGKEAAKTHAASLFDDEDDDGEIEQGDDDRGAS